MSAGGFVAEPRTGHGARVTVVMPTINRSAYLRSAIDQCLAQAHANIELIVVDDGSTDRTAEILRACTDPRVVVLRHARNLGLPEALNTGFRRATGEFLTWSSDDDLFTHGTLAALVEFLDCNPDVGLVYADYGVIDANGTVTRRVEVEPPEVLEEHNCVGCCRLYRRDVYDAVGEYNPAARLAEDYEYWLRVSRRFTIAPLHKLLYYKRDHAGSLTATHGAFAAARVAARVRYRIGIIDRRGYRRSLAALDMAEAFERHLQGRPDVVRRCVVRGLWRDPSYLANRGVLSILLKSVTGMGFRNGPPHPRIR